ncbi:MAG: glycosyltransferase family 2 protein [Dehalococcoidia bacterium]
MKLVVVVFAFNEEESIRGVLDRIPTFIDGIDHIQVIVIDDGSTDRTRALALERGTQVVSHPHNRGLGAAFVTGIDAALRARADIIVTLDGDGQHPPEAISHLIAPLLEGQADFATATRFRDPLLAPEMPLPNRLGNWLMARITGLACGRPFTDAACGFRAYSREAALRINICGNHTYTQESLLDLARKGIVMTEVPVAIRGVREHGQSRVAHSLIRYGSRALAILIRAVRDRLPFPFFGAIGAVFALLGTASELTVLANFVMTGKTSPYHSFTILGAILLILGAVCFLVALLADMLGRMRETQETLLYLEKRRYYDELARQHPGLEREQEPPALAHLAATGRKASPVLPLGVE